MQAHKILKQDDTISVLHAIHHDSRGIIEVCHIDKTTGKWDGVRRQYGTMQRHYLKPLTDNYQNRSMYFSLNSFKKFSRKTENLYELKAIWSDLDYYKTEYTKEQVLMALEDKVHNRIIPQPSFIVDSGQGLYVIWKIERTPPEALKRWRDVMRYIHEELKDYGADPRCLEPSRILRLDGSIHEKTKKTVQVISYSPLTYNLYSLKGVYLSSPQRKTNWDTETKSKPRTKSGKKYTFSSLTGSKNVLYLHNQYKSYQARLQDLDLLCELRDYDLEAYACRELICFLTMYWTYCISKNYDLAKEKAITLNAKFKTPLSENEITQRMQINKRALQLQAYRYSNTRLIEILNISEEEQYQLTAIHTKSIQLKKLDQERKEARRNTSGLTMRQQKKLDQEAKVMELVAKGCTTKEISEECELSVRRVQQIKKAMAAT